MQAEHVDLRQRREELGMSSKEMAFRIGVHKNTVVNFEKHGRKMKGENLKAYRDIIFQSERNGRHDLPDCARVALRHLWLALDLLHCPGGKAEGKAGEDLERMAKRMRQLLVKF